MQITKNDYFSLYIICNPYIIPNTTEYNNFDKEKLDDLLMPYVSHFNSYSNYYISNKIAENT